MPWRLAPTLGRWGPRHHAGTSWLRTRSEASQKGCCTSLSRALLRARREERWPCGLRVAIKRHRQSKAWQAGAERWTSLDMDERGGLGRACMLAPTSKGSNRLAQLTTNAMSRCVPVSLRSQVVYPLAADNVSRPLMSRLKGLHQPVVRSRIRLSAPRARLL